VGFLLVLAGLKELPLKTSARAHAGLRTKLLSANLLAATVWLFTLVDSSHLSEWLVYPLPVGVWFGVKLVRRGFGHDAAAAAEIMSRDKRAPVVYLRSFKHDDDRLIPWWSRILLYWVSVSFEQMLAATLDCVGPFIAIGRPTETVPELGAARLYCSDTEWRDRITDLITRWSFEAAGRKISGGKSSKRSGSSIHATSFSSWWKASMPDTASRVLGNCWAALCTSQKFRSPAG